MQEAIKNQRLLEKQEQKPAFKFGILGSFEVGINDHRFHASWRDVLNRIRHESVDYDLCEESNSGCDTRVRKWRKLLAGLKGRPEKEQLVKLNTAVNQMAKYADDKEIFGKKDHWATPSEFLKGRADCEDYATVKFWSLLELGFTNEQLRVAVVRDRRRGILHAVVTVNLNGKHYLLDSLFDHVVEQKYVLKYAPLYSANLDSQFVHVVNSKLRAAYLNQLEEREANILVAKKSGPVVHSASTSNRADLAEKRTMEPVRSQPQPLPAPTVEQGSAVDWT